MRQVIQRTRLQPEPPSPTGDVWEVVEYGDSKRRRLMTGTLADCAAAYPDADVELLSDDDDPR